MFNGSKEGGGAWSFRRDPSTFRTDGEWSGRSIREAGRAGWNVASVGRRRGAAEDPGADTGVAHARTRRHQSLARRRRRGTRARARRISPGVERCAGRASRADFTVHPCLSRHDDVAPPPSRPPSLRTGTRIASIAVATPDRIGYERRVPAFGPGTSDDASRRCLGSTRSSAG